MLFLGFSLKLEDDMNTVERVKMICKERKIPLSRLERECGFSNGYIGQLRKGSIPDDRLIKIANYLDMTVDQLTGVQTDAQPEGYYISEDTAKTAQQIFDDPYLRILFDAAQDSRPEDLQMAADLLRRLKKTNPDG
jgi:transcriptional regulator with XRE-family HTH domain